MAIKAAASVFARKGFHGASTRDIADELGIKQGSLYYYFKSKEEALGEVCVLGLEGYVRRMEQIAAARQTPREKLTAAVASHLSSYREKNEALKVHNDERLYLPEAKRGRLKELGSHYRELLEKVIEEGQASGDFRKGLDSHFAAQTVIGLCNAWGEQIVRNDDIEIFELTQKCADLLLLGLSSTDRQ